MPKPRKPSHLKALAGTARPDRKSVPAPTGNVLEEAPDAPDWLPNGHAIKEWNRLAPILVANRLLTDAAVSTLGHLCALHGKIVQLWAAGETPTGHLLAQYNKLIDAFGIPPVASTKLKPVGDGEKGNRFDKYKQGA